MNALNNLIVFYFTMWVLASLAGWGVGAHKGRPGAGFLWGFLLGFIGVIIAACMKSREQLEVIHWQHEELAARRRELGA